MIGHRFHFIFKRSVFLIDVQIVIFMKIIANIQIWVSVKVYITNTNTKPVTQRRAVNP